MKVKERKELFEFLKTQRCACCGRSGVIGSLTFHHIEPADKKVNVYEAATPKMALKEISKCIIVCSSCHRKYFHPDMDNYEHFYKHNRLSLKKPKEGLYKVKRTDRMARDLYKSVVSREYCECCGERRPLHKYVHPKKRATNFDELKAKDVLDVSSVHMVCSKCVPSVVRKWQDC